MFLFGKNNKGTPEEQKDKIEQEMFQAAKEKVLPYWAVNDAAKELVKRKIATNVDDEAKRLFQKAIGMGYIVVNMATKGTGKSLKPKKAENAVWDSMILEVNRVFSWNEATEENLADVLLKYEYMYFYITEGCTMEDARRVVKGLFQQALAKAYKGR